MTNDQNIKRLKQELEEIERIKKINKLKAIDSESKFVEDVLAKEKKAISDALTKEKKRNNRLTANLYIFFILIGFLINPILGLGIFICIIFDIMLNFTHNILKNIKNIKNIYENLRRN